MTRSRVRVEDLLVPKLLDKYSGGERWPVDEVTVRLAQKPLIPLLEAEQEVAALLRTATLFVVDFDEVHGVLQSAEECPLPDLPPLPYPRIAFEAEGDVGWPIHAAYGADTREEARLQIDRAIENDEEPYSILDLVVISETHEGREWRVVLFGRSHRPELAQGAFGGYVRMVQHLDVQADGTVRDRDGHRLDWRIADLPHRVAIELVHLVNARGVTLDPVLPSRPQRRQLERRRIVFPRIYFVNLRDGDEPVGGRSDREYHCRWLVRGHWRHLADKTRTWVRPYIKGPAGAPWRGRPVYVATQNGGRNG